MRKLEKKEMTAIVGGRACEDECQCVLTLLDAGADVNDAFDWCHDWYG